LSANVGHVPLTVGTCVGSVPAEPEAAPEEDPDEPPIEPEDEPVHPELDPVDPELDPEPLEFSSDVASLPAPPSPTESFCGV
jgi:hypothetical protein